MSQQVAIRSVSSQAVHEWPTDHGPVGVDRADSACDSAFSGDPGKLTTNIRVERQPFPAFR
jgi:hypothetical protein